MPSRTQDQYKDSTLPAQLDNQGHFHLANVWPDRGLVTIYAYKSAAFYGDPTTCCYRSQSALFPQIKLKPGESVRKVVVRLGEKAAVVKLKVLDAKTREPVQGSLLFVCTSNNSSNCIGGSVSSQDEVFIPAGSISMSVQAPKYIAWKYSGSTASASTPHFSSGETRSILVELEKAKLATVRGIVLDETGKAVESAGVFAESHRPLPAREFALITDTVTTDHEGRFVLELDSGPVTIWAFDQFHPNELNPALVPLCASPCRTPSISRVSGTYPDLNLKVGDDLSGVIVRLGDRHH